jgi:hypothetical protein
LIGGAVAGRILVAAALALGLIATFASANGVQAAPAHAEYSCTYHCYGINDWPGGPINGSHTAVSVVQLSCTPGASLCGQGWFIDNEMWLAQNTSCCSYWVEAGYSTYSNDHYTSIDYFWADLRPGSSYYEHVLSTVPSGDYGNYANLTIKRSSSSSFSVSISSPNYSYSGSSTSNSMTPNDINIGQELYGTIGASAPTAHYIYNQWIDTSNVSHYQTANGSITSDSPPYAGWTTWPSSSSTGGNMYTYCC